MYTYAPTRAHLLKSDLKVLNAQVLFIKRLLDPEYVLTEEETKEVVERLEFIISSSKLLMHILDVRASLKYHDKQERFRNQVEREHSLRPEARAEMLKKEQELVDSL